DVETFFEHGTWKYLATHFRRSYRPRQRSFRPGSEIIYWNGVPIARAVELAGRESAGGNLAAQHANGLLRLTKRDLTTLTPPEEEWVEVVYQTSRGVKEVRVDWQVLPELPPENGTTTQRRKNGSDLSIAHEMDHIRQVRKFVSAPHIIKRVKQIAAARD